MLRQIADEPLQPPNKAYVFPVVLTACDASAWASRPPSNRRLLVAACFPFCRIAVMKIALGADHAGFELKQKIKDHLIAQGVQVDDRGTVSNESVDYPDFARLVGEEVAQRQADFGILVCGSGIGMGMAPD